MTLIYDKEVTPVKNIAYYLGVKAEEVYNKASEVLEKKKTTFTMGDLKNIHILLTASEKSIFGLGEVKQVSTRNTIQGVARWENKPKMTPSHMYVINYRGNDYSTQELHEELKMSKCTINLKIKEFEVLTINGDEAKVRVALRTKNVPYFYDGNEVHTNISLFDVGELTGISYKYLSQQYRNKPTIIRGLVFAQEPLKDCFEQFPFVGFDKDKVFVYANATDAMRKMNLGEKNIKIYEAIKEHGSYKEGNKLIRRGNK